MCQHDESTRAHCTSSRRRILAGLSLAGLGAIAGCLGDEQDAPDPISLDAGDFCDTCDMDIGMHPGPVGQAYYADNDPPADRDGPATFCSVACTYEYIFEHATLGEDPIGIYATDYSSVDWEITDTGDPAISAHLEAAAFVDVGELVFVVDSPIEGAMGASLIGFADPDDADAFADEHGGDKYSHDEISQELIDGLNL